jgi:ribosome maturation factor RimP
MSKDELIKLLEPAIEHMGYELADLQLKTGGTDGLVRIFIDKAEGIGIEDCEAVSRQVSSILDVEDPVTGTGSHVDQASPFQAFHGPGCPRETEISAFRATQLSRPAEVGR